MIPYAIVNALYCTAPQPNCVYASHSSHEYDNCAHLESHMSTARIENLALVLVCFVALAVAGLMELMELMVD